MGHELRGGKLAPRLIQDIISYNPQKLDQGVIDALSEVLFHDLSEEDGNPPLPDISCQHHWIKKPNQTVVPTEGATSYESRSLRSFCLKCRCHLEVNVDHVQEASGLRPCPTVDRPLHHLVHTPSGDPSIKSSDNQRLGPWSRRWFICSSTSCGLRIGVQFHPPRLKNDWVVLLTDRHVIRGRADKAIASDPEKFQGHAPPTPGNVLETLCRLVNKASAQTDTKPIPKDSKGFLLNLGEQCAEILEFLGFSNDGSLWHFPKIDTPSSAMLSNPVQILLDDVRQEISALMLSRPDDERRTLKFSFSPVSGLGDLNKALSCETYKHRIEKLRVNMEALEHPSYAGLGTVANLHDELIIFAYERQIEIDHANLPYYLECLQTIAEGRASEDLSTKVAIEASGGRVSLKDIRSAYRSLGVGYRDPALADDTIIGTFQARLADSPRQEAELRQSLNIVGSHRGSSKLQNAAAKTVDDYEQAIGYLDATTDTPDPFIVSCYTVKVDAKPSEEAMARRAVVLVANHRRSKALRQWLATGTLGDVEMDVSQAYARLNIQERTVDDEVIINVYEFGAEEQPSQVDELKRALATIAKDRNSPSLMAYAGIENAEEEHTLTEWPVALNNIGNTCYLNSLLQFYFSIRPFRDLVLNIENFKSSLDPDQIISKRVGGRNVSRKEIERAQRTAEELRKLFNDLISSSLRSVRPDTELARLTLLTPKAENARRQSIRQSMNQEQRPIVVISSHDGNEVKNDHQAEQDQPSDDAIEYPLANASTGRDDDKKAIDVHLNNSSTETLVNDVAEANDPMSVDAVSISSQLGTVHDEPSHPPPQSELDGSKATAPLIENRLAGAAISETHPNTEMSSIKAPSQPPPIPPRPKTETKPEEAVKEAEFAAQQQDVNEIAYNILNQLQCAIRPISVDREGEQIDQIKELFYGKQKTFITSQAGQVRTKEEFMSDVRVSVHGGPVDIYAALDGAFDVEDVAVAGGIEPKYSTISHLPPVLQIHIQRGQYDSENKKQFKSVAHIELQELIYMDRYMDTEDPDVLRQREESWAWKRQLADLKHRRDRLLITDVGLNIPDAINCACEYLLQLQEIEDSPKVEVPGPLIEELQRAKQEAQATINDIEQSIGNLETQIATQFRSSKEIPYRLAAVFMHRGSTNAGHYWIYIFDFEKRLWRSYNDERVTLVKDTSEIFNPPSGDRPATPYFLVYVQDNIKQTLVDPVCRRVDPNTEQPKDIIMEEYEHIELDDYNAQSLNTWEDTAMTGGGW